MIIINFTRPTDFFDSLKCSVRDGQSIQRVDKAIDTLADFEKGR